MTLQREQFTQHIGPMEDVLNRNVFLGVLQAIPAVQQLTETEQDAVACACRKVIYEAGDTMLTRVRGCCVAVVFTSRLPPYPHKLNMHAFLLET